MTREKDVSSTRVFEPKTLSPLASFLIQFRSCMPCSRPIGLMAFFTQNGTADLRLERDRIVLAAVVADDLKTRRCIFAHGRFLRTAFRTTLRRHHISLVKQLLFFLGKKKDLAALYTRYLGIGHRGTPLKISYLVCMDSLPQRKFND